MRLGPHVLLPHPYAWRAPMGPLQPSRGHTQAKSLDELMIRTREAIELLLETASEPPEPLDSVGDQTLTVNG